MAKPNRRIWHRLSAASAIILCSCTPSPDSPSATAFPNWPTEFNSFRFHWGAAPGIDLTSGPAVAVRAYVESYRLGFLSRRESSVAYPGFLQATPENLPEDPGTPAELSDIRPEPLPTPDDDDPNNSPTEFFGYQPSYILTLEQIGNSYRVTVCEGYYATFRKSETDGKFLSIITDLPNGTSQYGEQAAVHVRRIDLTNQAAPGGVDTPASQQSGPMPAPSNDVFKPWFISAASTFLWGPLGKANTVSPPELQQQCADHMPDDAPARKALYTGLHDQPPPHGDPIPGWPDQE
ncbi:hypothetical protein H7J87_05880 [Mycolicibacterium wolinskyi]|uniref:hypothetical protein n=1 Tax=Mycolicibacterium TaxID=1866885 RepID=UPI00105545A1|nr:MULTISPECIES: hypothetical protein [Mycolicibacterium]MCV7284851.1 hypothetical protein [Mycolicibacterium wolinskyi]MCV7297911.1 hypothetical protein [Mycolicibacterium goodii]